MTSVLPSVAVSSLDKHEEVSTPTLGGCSRWPKSLRLLSSSGDLVMGRCGSPNKCEYCARLTAVEWAEMFSLDALDGNAPSVYMVLTTGTSTFDPSHFYAARRKVQAAIRRRYPAAELAWIVEATTGTSERSGGRRFPHWNVLVKNVSAADAPVILAAARKVWCARSELVAAPDAQWAGPVQELGGLMKYLALHFLKREQAMPVGWSGHRVTATRGYFTDERWRLRARAQDALRDKRELHRAIKEGLTGEDVELEVAARRARARRKSWGLVVLAPRPDGSARVRDLRNGEPRHFMRRKPMPEASFVDVDILARWRRGEVGVGPVHGLAAPHHGFGDLRESVAFGECGGHLVLFDSGQERPQVGDRSQYHDRV